MPTNNMVWVSKAAKVAKQVAQNKLVKTATNKQRDALVTAVAGSVTVSGKAALRRPFAYRKNRRLAVQLARQIGGTYDRAIIAGDRYWLVLEDETPFEVFPPLPEGIGPLAERRELKNFKGIRIDPSADSS